MRTIRISVGLLSLLAGPGAIAEDAVAPVPAAAPSVAAQAPKAEQRSKKGKNTREKEAEGTEAPNRFKTDTVIKSQYQLNGQSLEVDPD
ncbi:MAG: hypothetical protein ACXWP5_12740 [Bdellovibrionota bacterium]